MKIYFDIVSGENRSANSYELEEASSNDLFTADIQFDVCRLKAVIKPKKPFEITSCRLVMDYEFKEDDILFLNGYQSWTYCPERKTSDSDMKKSKLPKFISDYVGLKQYGDGYFYDKKAVSGFHHGYSYAYIRQNSDYKLFASLAENSGFTIIEFDTNNNCINLVKDCSGRIIDSDFMLYDFLILKGTEDAVFDEYFKFLNISAPSSGKLTGYTSWYNRYANISESSVLSDLKGMQTLPSNLDVFQIDDGYEKAVGDWMITNTKKFPDGMKNIAKKISENGFIPGIWIAPFACQKNSELCKQHPEFLLRDENGKKIYIGCNWGGAYALDIYNEEFREYLHECFDFYKREGFKLFKLDFLYAACMVPQKDKTRGEIMKDAVDFLCDELSDCLILGCGVPLASVFGKFGYCRIGCDMTLNLDGPFYMHINHPERPSTARTMIDTKNRRQLNGRAFYNDPDVFLLRSNNNHLDDKEKKELAEVNAKYGGLLFCSDDFSNYDDEQRKLFKEIIDEFNA